jgi:hypothetical protein
VTYTVVSKTYRSTTLALAAEVMLRDDEVWEIDPEHRDAGEGVNYQLVKWVWEPPVRHQVFGTLTAWFR